jgi:tripartite-type tricarboxylate transporter receptor subunit TctC
VPIWYAIMAPAGTNQEIIAKLNAKCVEIARTEDMQARMRAISAALPVQTPAEIVAYRDADSAGNAEVIKAANIKLE